MHYRTTDRDVAKGKTRNYVFKGSLETLVISFYWWYPPQHNELWWNNEVAVAPVKLSRQLCQLKTSHEHNRPGNNSRLQWRQKLWQVTSSRLLTLCNSTFPGFRKKKQNKTNSSFGSMVRVYNFKNKYILWEFTVLFKMTPSSAASKVTENTRLALPLNKFTCLRKWIHGRL